MTSLRVLSSDALSIKADVLVVGVSPGKGRKAAVSLSTNSLTWKASQRTRLEESLAVLGATGKAGEITRIPGTGITSATVVLAIGLGEPVDGRYVGEPLRKAAGSAIRSLAGQRKVAIALPSNENDCLHDVAVGALLGAYQFLAYRGATRADQKEPVREVQLIVADAKDKGVKQTIAHANAVAEAVNLARDFINTPPVDLYPENFAQQAIDRLADLPVEVEVTDDVALREGGYGGLTAVGQGSYRGPRLVRLAYRPAGATKHLSLVGKGITFDSGGLSLKPPKYMETMKCDMSGAAAVLAAVKAIATLGIQVNVTGWMALAENMPSGRATRPGDIITMLNGKTVEVLNTDAEGRLVLADALVRSSEDEPDITVNAATLTGAVVVALGNHINGIMSNDDVLRAHVEAAGKAVGEAYWPLPLPADLEADIESPVADLKNIGSPGVAGTITAGLFLQHFVEGRRWAHLDIAGPAFNEGRPSGYTPAGGTGAAVRTFIKLAEDLADGELS
jgi:leucyl aminopeptidase